MINGVKYRPPVAHGLDDVKELAARGLLKEGPEQAEVLKRAWVELVREMA